MGRGKEKRGVVWISSLVNRSGAKQLREYVITENPRGDELAKAITGHFNAMHSVNFPVDPELEKLIDGNGAEDYAPVKLEKGVVTFSPSSAFKCERELFYKANHASNVTIIHPYQKRWLRNASAVHAATQRDLLYAEKHLEKPLFGVMKTAEGLPAWERNIQRVRQFTRDGIRFQIYGMMDGVLQYMRDKSLIGLEFKTKSTTIASIGPYKMKETQPAHREQCTGYSMLFDLEEFLVVYESLAKDNWNKGEEARPDLRAFCITVADWERERLLDKFARVARHVYESTVPTPDYSKCLFCPYRVICDEYERGGTAI
jgi:hypothetical protein